MLSNATLLFCAIILWLQVFSTNPAFAIDYQLSSGDTVVIEVYNEPDLTTRAKINKSGVISFPFLDNIKISGKTTEQIEAIIDRGLRGDYLINPQVSVSIIAYRPFFYSWSGKYSRGISLPA